MAQRLTAAQSRALFFPAAPLMGKALTGEEAVTPCSGVLQGPLVLWSPGPALPTLIAGARVVVDAPQAPTAPQWVLQDGTVVAGSEAGKLKGGGHGQVAGDGVKVEPDVKMESMESIAHAIKSEDLAAAAIAAAAAVMPMDVARAPLS